MRPDRELILFVLFFGAMHAGITYWSMQVGTLRGVLTGLCCIVIWLCLWALFRHDARREREAALLLPRRPFPQDWHAPDYDEGDTFPEARRASLRLVHDRNRTV